MRIWMDSIHWIQLIAFYWFYWFIKWNPNPNPNCSPFAVQILHITITEFGMHHHDHRAILISPETRKPGRTLENFRRNSKKRNQAIWIVRTQSGPTTDSLAVCSLLEVQIQNIQHLTSNAIQMRFFWGPNKRVCNRWRHLFFGTNPVGSHLLALEIA